MSFDKVQFRETIKKVLDYLGLNTPAAVELLMMTAAQESALGRYLHQTKGPANGVFQIEPNTEKDIWDRFLAKHPDLKAKVQALLPTTDVTPEIPNMQSNLEYQIAMARIFYYRIPASLPLVTDLNGLANYYKKYFNTYLGKATITEVLQNYKKYC